MTDTLSQLQFPALPEGCELATFLDEATIQARLDELVVALDTQLAQWDQPVVLLGVLNGGMMLMTDVARRMKTPHCWGTVKLSRYGDDTSTDRPVQVKSWQTPDLVGKTVVVVDDILDTGRTLNWLVETLKQEHFPANVYSVVLLDKPSRREVPYTADAIGFKIPDLFAVGYGMDYQGFGRNWPYVGVVKPIGSPLEA